jgi:hypothetical protein
MIEMSIMAPSYLSVGEKIHIKYENYDNRVSASFYGVVEILCQL